jgi:hypothetical protein
MAVKMPEKGKEKGRSSRPENLTENLGPRADSAQAQI